MTTVIQLNEIKSIVDNLDLLSAIEEGFVQYSNGKTVVPPVAELLFDAPPGDVHIKYGYIKNTKYYCIKIASGFYDNPKLGLASSQGMMLLFSQKTGQPVAVLLDEGFLTDIRTAVAGALAARYFAPKKIKAIGIIGTGGQGKLQLEYLQKTTPCKNVWLWGRSKESVASYIETMGSAYNIQVASTTAELATHCNLIVTTTPVTSPLLFARDIQPGTHITAMGSDTSEKQELAAEILKKADIVISDSIPQSKSRGEVFQAVQAGAITNQKVVELGTAIQNPEWHRANDKQVSVVDLTGVAVQDIMISVAVYEAFLAFKKTRND